MTEPTAVFRADASVRIGSGHVMRCLTLADALSDRGFVCHFLCRDLEGHMCAEIARRGHQVTLLPTPEAERRDSWLGVDWQFDAAQCATALGQIAPEWLVVDHYGLDGRWEAQFTESGRRIAIIDDLADRPHVADLLVDQTLDRKAEDYAGFAPENCTLLLGPRYALLRSEFRVRRERALSRRRDAKLRNIMIAMGGVDLNNTTGSILSALSSGGLRDDICLTVVLGSLNPWVSEIHKVMETLDHSVELHVGADNMAQLMEVADLAIGAAGSTSWERCCLGLPTIILVLAENQVEIARSLENIEAAKYIELSALQERLPGLVAQIGSNEEWLLKASAAAAIVCDGRGVDRVCDVFVLGSEE